MPDKIEKRCLILVITKSIKKMIKENPFIWNLYMIYRKYNFNKNYISVLKKDFKRRLGYELNLKCPETFNEKIQWLKAFYYDPIMTQCADKYEVREIIADQIGEQYLVPLYGVYDRAEDIPLRELPKEFVLKPNHASGHVILCHDKNSMEWDKEYKKLNRWLKENYYYQNGEWVYRDIKPRIICEHLLHGEMIDYKFMCFYGEPKLLFTCSERETGLKVTFFDMNFHKLPFIRKYPSSNNIQKPEFFDDMVRCSKILSKRFPFVRVDFYENEGKLYFGELTFFPGNGMEYFEPEEWDKKIGDLLDLSKIDSDKIAKNYQRGD